MFYHPGDNKSTIIIKHMVFWTSLFAMFVLFIFMFLGDSMLSQKEITLYIDVKNKVNICLPEEEKNSEISFFGL